MGEKVPDYFEDPMDKFEKEIRQNFIDAYEKYGEYYELPMSWAASWLGHYDHISDNQEMPDVDIEHHLLRHVIQQEYIMMDILEELKKLNSKDKHS